MDVTIAKVQEAEKLYTGSEPYLHITEYEEYRMQCNMHELSIAALSMTVPVPISGNYWKYATESPLMNSTSRLLKKYCTDAGMSPLASEWWHFNDMEASDKIGVRYGFSYDFSTVMSVAP